MRKIVFKAYAGDAGNPIKHESEPEEFEDDVTDKDLDKMAEEYMWEHVSPEFGWREVK